MAAGRLKMKREERAKQFAPFAALKGFEEALRAREHVVTEPVHLSDEKKDELDRLINIIKNGDIVRVVYYDGQEYVVLVGMVSRIDITARLLKVINTRIEFADIVDLEITQ